MIGIDLLATALLMAPGNAFTQGTLAADFGVMGIACEQAVDCRLHDGGRGIEIRIAYR